MNVILLLFLLSTTGDLEDVKAFPGFTNVKACNERRQELQAYYAQQGMIVRGKCITDI